jgi:hypothetical protein
MGTIKVTAEKANRRNNQFVSDGKGVPVKNDWDISPRLYARIGGELLVRGR